MSTFNMHINMGPEEACDAINGYLENVAQMFAGDTPPAILLPGMLWIDTANRVIKQRNIANTAWIVRGYLDYVFKIVDGSLALEEVEG